MELVFSRTPASRRPEPHCHCHWVIAVSAGFGYSTRLSESSTSHVGLLLRIGLGKRAVPSSHEPLKNKVVRILCLPVFVDCCMSV